MFSELISIIFLSLCYVLLPLGYGCYRINGNLALSRAVGDRYQRPYMSSEPDIQCHKLNPSEAGKEGWEGDSFIVLASDGLWDVLTSQGVVDHIIGAMKAEESQMDVRRFAAHKGHVVSIYTSSSSLVD